jgi:DNA-binding MurR/RpiR family transcriptional regulator
VVSGWSTSSFPSARTTSFTVAHNRLAREMRVALDFARKVGAKVVLLTETLGEALRNHADVILSAPMGRPGMYGGQTTTLVVLEALTMAVAAQDEVVAPSPANGTPSRKRRP